MAMLFVTGERSFYAMRVAARARGGRLLPRHRALPDLLDPGPRARAQRRPLHDGGAGRDPGRRAALGGAAARSTAGSGSRGWQWLFLVEGLPAVVLGLARPPGPDRSARAGRAGSHPEGRAWLSAEMAREREDARAARRLLAEPARPEARAALPHLLPEHDRDLRHLPLAAPDDRGGLGAPQLRGRA